MVSLVVSSLGSQSVAVIDTFPDLASRFLAGEALDHPVAAYHSPVQAVEAFIASESYLMVVTDEDVRVSEILSVRLRPRSNPDGRASPHVPGGDGLGGDQGPSTFLWYR